MRKLLAILLIATIACNGLVETIESFNKILDYFELDKEAIELGFLDFFEDIWDYIQDGIDWLKENGFWDTIKSIAKTYGKYKATEYCEKKAKIDGCGDIVKTIIDKI